MDEKYRKNTLLIIGVSFLIRLFIAAFYGLSGDEAHYFQYAVHPSISYFDHPPMVGYAIVPFLKLCGQTNLAVRMPALISSTLCMWLIYIIGKNLYCSATGFWAVVVFCLVPLFSVLGGIMTVPDTILSVFWLLLIIVVWKIYVTGRSELWYVAGLIVGLSLLTKYSGILLYLCILLFMILNRQMWKQFRHRHIYLGFTISVIFFLPVLIWNYDNYWASFVFQFKHGLGEKIFFRPQVFLQNIVAQMSVISPFLWIVLMMNFFVIVKKVLQSDKISQLFFSFCFPVFIVFGYAGLSNEILPHWPAQGYLTMIVPCAFFIKNVFEKSYRLKKNIIGFVLFSAGLFTLIIPVQVVFRCINVPREIDPTGDLYGWDTAAVFAEYLRNNSGSDAFLFTHKFYLASQMAFYLPENTARKHLYCFSKRVDQYDFWQQHLDLKNVLNGKTGIFFTDDHFKDSPEKFYKFKKIDKPVTLKIFYRGKNVKTFYFYVCHSFETDHTDNEFFNSLNFSPRSFLKKVIELDNNAFLSLNRFASRHSNLAKILFGFGYLGSAEITTLVVALILYFFRRQEFLKYFGMFFVILVIGALMVHFFKEIFHSPRPTGFFKQTEIFVVGPVLKSGSFPSGHSQTSFAAAVFLSFLFKKFSLIFIVAAITVSFSRVFSGVHFIRDVAVGAIIGVISCLIVFGCRFLLLKKRNLTISKK